VFVGGGAQGDPGRTGLQGLEHRLVVADPFGEESHEGPAGEQPPTGPEGVVVGGRGLPVGGPVDGDHPGQLEEGPEEWDPEEGRLPEEAGQGGHEEQGVDETVDVVGHEDGGTVDRELPEALDLDPAEEDPDEDPGQPPHRPLGDPAHGL